MTALLFVLFVVAGFIFMLVAKWPTGTGPWPERLAWFCWLFSALIWGYGVLGK